MAVAATPMVTADGDGNGDRNDDGGGDNNSDGDDDNSGGFTPSPLEKGAVEPSNNLCSFD